MGQTPGRGRDTVRPECMYSCVGGIILWRTLELEWTESKELSRHTVLPPERTEPETERSVYLQSKRVSAHRAGECFWFKLKPRRNSIRGVLVVVVVVLQKMWVFMFSHATLCDVEFTSAGACKCIPWEVHIRVHGSVSLVFGRRGKNPAAGSAALMELLTCVGLGRLLTRKRRQIFIVFTVLTSDLWPTYLHNSTGSWCVLRIFQNRKHACNVFILVHIEKTVQ